MKPPNFLAHLWLLGIGWGRSVAAARQRQAAGGGGERRGRCSGGRGGEEEVEELLGDVAKLEVRPIGVEKV
jgi:hypothetical protein